ncbi:MAG: PD-(D/E)XK nuclease family protein [Gammaproteobacteria bacterium]|nr:PD-(D/E)XK nuclease family protein [Gammaproteobacteria bacterium]MDE0249210.1 PD-(D/E)XK nuclease family protein [Gammaproteobacteria bacterium]
MASALEELLLDDSGLPNIALHLGGFNIFEAIGHTRSEARHSDFLAFLIDPNETHDLRTEFLKRLVVDIVEPIQPELRPLSLSDILLADFNSCQVLREYHRIDILCIDEPHRFLLAIENKIESREHSDQLNRYSSFLKTEYPEYRRILAYLTPENDKPSDNSWAPVSYSNILSIVEKLTRTHRDRLSNAVIIALDHYAHMLRRHIVTDEELVNVARTVYRKHKAALDFIFEQIPDDRLEISEFAKNIASKDSRIKVVPSSKSYIRFFPKDWEKIPLFKTTPKNQWTKTRHSLLFEIKNLENSIRMTIVIGPTEEHYQRHKIFEHCRNNRQLFRNIRTEVSREFTQVYSKIMVNKRTLHTQPIEKIKHQLQKKFQGFMDSEFGDIVDAMSEEFGPS